jgi:integrase
MRKWDHLALAYRRKSYAIRALRSIELTFPAMIDQLVAEIDRDHVSAAVDAALETRGPAAAIMAASAMGTLWRWAKKHRLVVDDIMLGFPMPEGGSARQRTLNEDECRRMFRAAGMIGYPSGSFVQLLLLTGARRDEMRKLQWSEIVEDEIEGAVIDLPADRVKTGRKSGGHKIHLSPAALGVIADCPRHQGCPFIFTSDGIKAQGDVTRLKKKLDALLAKDGGPPMAAWVFHDFRRSLVSGLAKRGHNAIALDLLLGHKPTGLSAIAQIYQTNTFGP